MESWVTSSPRRGAGWMCSITFNVMAQSVVLVAPQYKEPLKVIQHEIEKNIPNIDVSTLLLARAQNSLSMIIFL